MGLIIRVGKYDFVRKFEDMGRGNQFSREGLTALYEYLDELSDNCYEHSVSDTGFEPPPRCDYDFS